MTFYILMHCIIFKDPRRGGKELLNGQSAQGPLTAEDLYATLKAHKIGDM